MLDPQHRPLSLAKSVNRRFGEFADHCHAYTKTENSPCRRAKANRQRVGRRLRLGENGNRNRRRRVIASVVSPFALPTTPPKDKDGRGLSVLFPEGTVRLALPGCELKPGGCRWRTQTQNASG